MTNNEWFWLKHDLRNWAWYYGLKYSRILLWAGIVIAVFIWVGIGEAENLKWGLL